jgi:prolyl-tRNA synthetase
MRLSKLFTQTSREASRSDISRYAQFLTRAGYIDKLMAGVYSYLPLGLRVLNKIEAIIREEMDAVGGQEILMPSLQPKEIWEQTDRWQKLDVLFRFKGHGDRDLTLGPTHEEVVTPLVTSFVQSYRDLPKAVYQIQTKFRNEARAKSGLLRGREFRMKDMYSFHATSQDLDEFYDRVIIAYKKIFSRCGLGDQTLLTYASGGAFCDFSHEFQTITPYGEDTIFCLPQTDVAVNREIINEKSLIKDIFNQKSIDDLEEVKAIEVGNIFKLGTRFTDAFSKTYADTFGINQKIHMGCYGIGSSRLMGTVAECLSDDRGLVWPEEISPFDFHLVALTGSEEERKAADDVYYLIKNTGMSVLYDDRHLKAGEKLADCDLIGISNRIIVSSKTLLDESIEIKKRSEKKSDFIKILDVPTICKKPDKVSA